MPANAGTMETPSSGAIRFPANSVGYSAFATSKAVAIRSIRCVGSSRNSPFADTPAGQCTTRGDAMPPSCTQCLYVRKGVLEALAQAWP